MLRLTTAKTPTCKYGISLDGGLGVDCHSHQCEYGPILQGLRAHGIIITGPTPITPLERAQRKAERQVLDMIVGDTPPPETPEAAAEIAAIASGEAPLPDAELLADLPESQGNSERILGSRYSAPDALLRRPRGIGWHWRHCLSNGPQYQDGPLE